MKDAEGELLANVFQIVNETTRQPVESPADKVKSTGSVVGLANHTILNIVGVTSKCSALRRVRGCVETPLKPVVFPLLAFSF
jgi:hypothetical protein